MENNIKKTDKINEIYDNIEQNQKKYQQLMSGDNAVGNAVKFNAMLNKRMKKLGINTCKYVPAEDTDGKD